MAMVVILYRRHCSCCLFVCLKSAFRNDEEAENKTNAAARCLDGLIFGVFDVLCANKYFRL